MRELRTLDMNDTLVATLRSLYVEPSDSVKLRLDAADEIERLKILLKHYEENEELNRNYT